MAAFQQINELRKAGKLEEAYQLAQQALAIDHSIWNQRAMAWVLYGLLKNAESNRQPIEATEILEEIVKLELPAEEHLFWEKIPWQIAKLIFDLPENTAAYPILEQLFDLLSQLPIKIPGEGYSFLLRAFHKKGKRWNRFPDFLDWWNPDAFLKSDFEPAPLPNGKRGMALVEQVLIAYAKLLLGEADTATAPGISDTARIHTFLPLMRRIGEAYPTFRYVQYYLAQLLLAVQQHEEAKRAFLPFARQKSAEYWVWDTMADLFGSNAELQFACLCKAVSCPMEDKFSVKLRRRLVPLLLAKGYTEQAAAQVYRINQIYTHEGWHIPSEVQQWMRMPWAEAHPSTPPASFFMEHARQAEQLLYADTPENIILISGINRDKHVLYFISETEQQGFFHFKAPGMHIDLGMAFRARLAEENGRFRAYSLLPIAEADIPPNLFKSFSGVLKCTPGKSFGFIGDVFLPPALIATHALTNGQVLSGTAIRTWDKQKARLGWRAEKIQIEPPTSQPPQQ